eukprot:scaffold1366_cov233-Pinguiococcus_pyrenoidosus.AAC.4
MLLRWRVLSDNMFHLSCDAAESVLLHKVEGNDVHAYRRVDLPSPCRARPGNRQLHDLFLIVRRPSLLCYYLRGATVRPGLLLGRFPIRNAMQRLADAVDGGHLLLEVLARYPVEELYSLGLNVYVIRPAPRLPGKPTLAHELS